MHVLFVSGLNSAPWGGSEELWFRVARKLIATGDQVSALIVRRTSDVPQLVELAANGCRMHWIERPTLLQRAVRKLLPVSGQVLKLLRRIRPDLVVIALPISSEATHDHLACIENGIPYILVVQNAAECYWPSDEDLEFLVPAYQNSLRCFFVSENNRELTERQLGLALPNAEIVRNPFNVAYDCALPWPDEGMGFRLACVARLDPAAKGQDVILQVLSQKKWRERPITVSFYGTGHNNISLRRLAFAYFGLSNVFFCGHVGDIHAIWKEHHALVMPSRFEGLPLVVVEAMLCRRLCIVTAVAGNPEVIDDNRTGFLSTAPTAGQLDEAMERAWLRRDEWRLIGELASQDIRTKIPKDPVELFLARLREIVSIHKNSVELN